MKKQANVYTLEEVDALKRWFDEQGNNIPSEMAIEKSTYSPNLRLTIQMLFEQAYICYNNPKMQGCLLLLEKIKSNIENNQSS
ncbi:MAG: hypothetical protein J6I70_02390 [Bacteroidaceae bacterium]|nr:hypothetical protein [Bacteroidaceae bacterium]MBR6621292.1 hypothetical protein [Bacteroides sp.]